MAWVLVLYIAGVSEAIILDSSCNAYGSLLTAGFTNAFTNANEAQLALAENPLDSEIEELAGWLFGASTNYAIAQTRLRNVGNIPKTITSDKTDKSNMANIVVYCNLDRYQKTNRRDGALYDPDSKVYQAVSDPTFQSSHNDRFCAWYLEQVKNQQFQLITSVDTPGVLQRLTTELQLQQNDQTDMDAAALFETTVLHEMTHSKAVGIPQVDMGIGEVYGWAGMVDLQSPNNSDTLAFFALAVYLILHLYNVLKSGQVVAVSLQDSDSGSKKKRALGSLLAKGFLARNWEA